MGAHVGQFEVQGELERTPAFALYRAMHQGLGKPVVVKVLLAAAQAGPDVRQRFLAEAQALMRLEHPSIQKVLEVGEAQGQLYVAMEPTAAGRVGALLSQRTEPLPALTCAQIAARLAGALEHAHAQGVVHRDVCLGSVLLGADGVPLLTDFGVTRDVDPSAPGVAQTGRSMGTPGYSSPEQASGQVSRIGPGVDVYGLGAVLYTLLVRRTPIQGNSPMGIQARTMSQVPEPPSRFRSDIPPPLEELCLRCLAKSPEQRFPTAGALRQALEGLVAAASGELPPPAGGRVRLNHPGAPQPAPAVPVGQLQGTTDPELEDFQGEAPVKQSGARRGRRTRKGRSAPEEGEEGKKQKRSPLPLVIAGAVGLLVLAGLGVALLGSSDPPPKTGGTTGDVVEGPAGDDAGDAPADDGAADAPRDAQSLLEDGIEALGRGDHQAALTALDGALKEDPNLAAAYHNRGNAHYALGDHAKAREDFTIAIELDPQAAEAFHNRGAAAESEGKTAEAIADYEKFLELRPDHPQADGVRADIERLRGS